MLVLESACSMCVCQYIRSLHAAVYTHGELHSLHCQVQLLCYMQVRATLEDAFTNSVRQGVGPINLNFTIPMYCASKLQVRYLQIMKHDKNYSPYRWVRYVTMSNSYVIRTR